MQENKSEKPPVTPQRIMQFAFGYAAPIMMQTAVEMRIFDILDSGPKTVEEVSREATASRRGIRALLNGLIALELLAKDGERYRLTPESQAFLVSTKPSFHGGMLKHTCQQLIPKWMQLTQTVRTGKPAMAVNEQREGSAFFQQFVESIFPMSYAAASALGDALKLPAADKPVSVLDLATGSGVWGVALAQNRRT